MRPPKSDKPSSKNTTGVPKGVPGKKQSEQGQHGLYRYKNTQSQLSPKFPEEQINNAIETLKEQIEKKLFSDNAEFNSNFEKKAQIRHYDPLESQNESQKDARIRRFLQDRIPSVSKNLKQNAGTSASKGDILRNTIEKIATYICITLNSHNQIT